MLRLLRIKNLAVIEEVTWELAPGFNILTGETGAGKSILIDALSMLLGERADRGMVRDGAEVASVEASLDAPETCAAILEEAGLDPLEEGGELILRRTVSAQGQGRQFVNGSPVPLQVLKKLGRVLVDLHGPHDHQSLLDTGEQMAALDAFAKSEPLAGEHRALFAKSAALRRELESLRGQDAGGWQERIDFLKFQADEIAKAGVKPGEDEALDVEYRVATNSKRILELGAAAAALISEGENDLLGRLAQVQKLLQEWQRLDPDAGVLAEMNAGIVAQLRDLEQEIGRLVEKTELDGERLRSIEDRLDLLQGLKRKHGPSLEAVLQKLAELEEQLAGLEGREGKIAELEGLIAASEKQRAALAKKLRKEREAGAPKLAAQITKNLKDLGFKKSEFLVRLEPAEVAKAAGEDEIEFMFAPNPGESARPLRAIASSGEMARVMLAVKTVLAAQDSVPILIFDEVDANVGGETAVAVGRKLRGLAARHQVLCITHLPQVAAHGQAHFRVSKEVKGGRTLTELDRLEKEIRVDEIARMLGGRNESALALGRDLLRQAEGV
jgi:DNA repair protein RecN (Recombination protein N)